MSLQPEPIGPVPEQPALPALPSRVAIRGCGCVTNWAPSRSLSEVCVTLHAIWRDCCCRPN
jgi:hypothetical protein